MLRFKPRSILVATDLTTASDEVLRSAAALAALCDAELHVVHAFDLQASPYTDPKVGVTVFQGRIAHAGQLFEEQRRRTVPADLEVASWELVIYSAHKAILERAVAVAADLIVLGPHRGNPMLDRFLGGTADRVIRSSAVPCLVVRRPLSLPPRRVVVPLDLSEPARGALEVALAWSDACGPQESGAEFLTVELDVLHVIPRVYAAEDVPFDPAVFGPELHREVEKARSGSGKVVVVVREEVVWGDDVAEEIVRHAERRQAELLVLATHGYGALKRALIGSVASAVARRAPCSVLLVPPSLWREEAERSPAAMEVSLSRVR